MANIANICITRRETVRDALLKLDRSGSGVLLLVDDAHKLLRTITDGDIRRIMLEGVALDEKLSAFPPLTSTSIAAGYSRREALTLMQKKSISHLPVLDSEGQVIDLAERTKIDEQILLSTPHMGEDELEFVEQAFRSNWIAPLGPNVDAFERELAEKVEAGHALATVSGTAAIHLALRVLDVGPGDTVFCSTLTFVASVAPVLYQGAEPVFIDSEPTSWNMSPVALERALEAAKRAQKLPKAIIVVNLYGQSADMDPIMALCEQYHVPLVEDAAESLGACYKGRASGTFGLLGIYSFNGNKIITTSGGGMLVSPDKKLIDRARFLSTQAREPARHYEHTTVGYNYRMSNILAGVGRGQLNVLDQRVEARRRVFAMYKAILADASWIAMMPEPDWSFSTHWLSACTFDDAGGPTANAVIERLSDEFIEARPIWKPMHLQPVFSGCTYYSHSNRSVSDDVFVRGICLPSGSNLEDHQIERIADCILKAA